LAQGSSFAKARMTRRKALTRPWLALAVVAAGLGVAAQSAQAAVLDVFYERALMVEANTRCGLFSPAIAGALTAAKVQARGAALRSGADEDRVVRVEQLATQRADGVACTSPDVALAAQRVRSAFEGFARLSAVDYPGDIAGWHGEHVRPEAGLAAWGLSQATTFGADGMRFGMAVRGANQPLMAVASFADGGQPYAARLILRDRSRAPRPYLDRPRGAALGSLPLRSRLPPRFASQVFTAEARSAAGRDLREPRRSRGWAFRFPAAAAGAMAELDPRESVAVEFVFAADDGDAVRTAYVEVGDFAAGRAFLMAGRN
jgi:hypothetical protein